MTDAARPTLRALLARRDLALVPIVDGDVDAEIRWVHSSDLADPTPFLSEGLALLTTGTQFGADDPAAVYDAYVARLAARGVVALGFGTEVVRDGVPPLLVAAARAARMPLVEVPYRTPFIAVARANAEAVAARAYARRSWSLAAQRAVSHAALRADGLHATVVELARQLDAWVGLYDAGGALGHEAGALGTRGSRGSRDGSADAAAWDGSTDAAGPAAAARAVIDARVREHLQLAASSSATFDVEGDRVGLQTLGRGRHLRGVLVVAGPRLDAEARGVVDAVAALAGLALGESASLRHARGMLRTAVLRALQDGDLVLAARVATALGGLPLDPSGLVQVAVVGDGDAPRDGLDEWLEARAARVLGGRLDDELVLLAADEHVVHELARDFAVSVGVSAPAEPGGFCTALAQARAARRGRGVRRFAASAVLTAPTAEAAHVHATALLAPLVAHDATAGTDLVGTVRVWLGEDGNHEAAARRLGVHRHTVRARVALAERLLGRDLGGFPARAELWAALVRTS